MIFTEPRDPRFMRRHRGGSLTEADHRLLALWAAACAEHVLPLYEAEHPGDRRPREAVALARAWARGEIGARAAMAAGQGRAAAREVGGAPKFVALAAAQAVAVAHVAQHELGAAAYAIRAREAAEGAAAARAERDWQRAELPEPIRALVLDDQRLRNHACWGVFG
ncbi:putative immunity protein [Pseudoroseicyclus sp. CXY001]|uniref:putative immunity protein n=1 Tax=Pseudoroseicyclus sp. CXY001 TaxID=3242492 RepID=UPI003570A90E